MGTKRVLLVEDDAEVRFVIRETLQRDGWTVLEAESYEDSIKAWKTSDPAPTIIFADLNLRFPGEGLDIASAIKLLSPSVKVIITTGDLNMACPEDYHLIHKPFLFSKLQQFVNTVAELP